MIARWLAGFALLLAALAAHAQADFAREKRWADEITPAILVGEPIYLSEPSGHRFLALYAARQGAPAGIIVVHGLGVHPDFGLINTLRSALADHGYATLSVQMPVLAADAKADAYVPLYPEAGERLQVAADFLRKAGYPKIAIVSHSLGSRMADSYLASAPRAIDAWVSIGLTGTYSKPDALRCPVLDLFGENDMPGVIASAPQRADVLRKVRGSAQVQAAGADHFFNGRDADLVRQVELFLDRAVK
jgi:pimeloyl-ACP methyl ester carboxylesterase